MHKDNIATLSVNVYNFTAINIRHHLVKKSIFNNVTVV